MKKFLMVVLMCFLAYPTWGSVVHLRNGAEVEGEVQDVTTENIKVDIGGVVVTYYKDEISHISNDVFSATTLGVPTEKPISKVSSDNHVLEVMSEDPKKHTLSEKKKNLIRNFTKVFGTDEAMRNNFDRMSQGLPADKAVQFNESFDVDEIIETLMPIYDKHFTEGDLAEYIGFYSSSAGKKLLSNIPLVMQESLGVTANYFDAHMPEELKNYRPEEK